MTDSTCCDNTAPRHLMTGRLMTDSVALWARDYRPASFRFDIMGHLLPAGTAADIRARLRFHNLGSAQVATLLAGHVDGVGSAGANFGELAYFINTGLTAETVTVAALAGKAFELHPVHASGTDRRAASASYTAGSGAFTIPARTAMVFVVR